MIEFDFQIDTINDLPVGEELSDHMSYPLYFDLPQDSNVHSINLKTLLNPLAMINYLFNGEGFVMTTVRGMR